MRSKNQNSSFWLKTLLFRASRWSTLNVRVTHTHTHTRAHSKPGQMQDHDRLIILHQTQRLCVWKWILAFIHSLVHTKTQISSAIATRAVCHGRLHYMLHSRRYELCRGRPFQQHFTGGDFVRFICCAIYTEETAEENQGPRWVRDISVRIFFLKPKTLNMRQPKAKAPPHHAHLVLQPHSHKSYS